MWDQQIQRGITICTVVPLLVTGTVASITTTVTSAHACNGKVQTPVTAITNGTTPVLDYNTGAAFLPIAGVLGVSGQGTVVVFAFLEGSAETGINAIKCMQGTVTNLEVGGTTFIIPPQFPKIPNNVCPFAYMILKQTSQETQSATFGTTDWAAGDYFTNAIVRCMQIPVHPQVS